MPVITLTTDLGTRDYYSGVVKGELLKAIPDAKLVDISHDIDPYNILHGAFVFRNVYHHFPENTIHLISVNPFDNPACPALIIRHENYYFIGQDNGFFALIWDDIMPGQIFQAEQIENEKESTLPIADLYVRLAKHLASGKNPAKTGTQIPRYKVMLRGKPIISVDFMKGSIEYFDRFGNAMVNIHRDEFEQVRRGRTFMVIFKRYADVELLSENYSAVPESEKLCFFNSAGYLEIAINKGNAKNLLNLSVGDFVQIEFQKE
ncbi:MAG: SAM-dependent chlorinase/fluorinase [Chitinophagales bacterium]